MIFKIIKVKICSIFKNIIPTKKFLTKMSICMIKIYFPIKLLKGEFVVYVK